MRKKTLLILILVMSIFTILCGCGKSSEEKIDDALQGSWRTSKDAVLGVQYGMNFSEGRFEYVMCLNGQEKILNEGRYVIGDTTITLQFEQGEKGETIIDFTFDNNTLLLSNDTLGQIHNMNE